MRVLVCGGGLGGLVLAQALRDRADVVVLDRDAAPADTGGYRISLTPPAFRVVRRHLPATTVARLRSVSDGPETFAQFTIATSRLRPIVIAPEPEGQDRLLCPRRALRLLLAEGLGDRLRFGSAVVSAEQSADGASVTLAYGTRWDGDLVVAADGASSVVAPGHAAPPSTDTGLRGIAGSTPLVPDAWVPPFLRRGPALALDARGNGLFLSLTSGAAGVEDEDLRAATGPLALVWGLIARRDALPDLRGSRGAELQDVAARQLADWTPWLPQEIEGADPDRTAWFRFRAADIRRPLFLDRPGRITAIGDAVHAMPPTGGRAGSTAILSAGALAAELRSGVTVPEAVARYQQAAPQWAVPAIRESMGPVRILRALRNPVVQAVAGPLLGLGGAVGGARYRSRAV